MTKYICEHHLLWGGLGIIMTLTLSFAIPNGMILSENDWKCCNIDGKYNSELFWAKTYFEYQLGLFFFVLAVLILHLNYRYGWIGLKECTRK